MSIFSRLIAISISATILLSCSASGYIADPQSIKRQEQMRNYRTGVNIADIGMIVAASVGALYTGMNVYANPQTQSFRKMRLLNDSQDTLFVNMVTDFHWRDSTFCDIRDIVLPPLQKAQVIVPLGAIYNIFFRNQFNAPDDEKVEINTAVISKVRLKPEKVRSGGPVKN